MSATIGYDEIVRMLRAAVERVQKNKDTLSRLDSVGGDGDHGTTMARAMGNLEKAIAAAKKRDVKALLSYIGWAILGVDGGATGPLFGTFFIGMSESAPGKGAIDAPALAAIFEAGLAALQKQSKAKVGDKTMMDALIPAVAALRAAAAAGKDAATALCDAAAAAQQGADSTKNFAAKFGRAKNLGDRTIGHPDPGAVSTALLFRGFAEGVKA
jgi:dihydroxyacetone kinase-like protein